MFKNDVKRLDKEILFLHEKCLQLRGIMDPIERFMVRTEERLERLEMLEVKLNGAVELDCGCTGQCICYTRK